MITLESSLVVLAAADWVPWLVIGAGVGVVGVTVAWAVGRWSARGASGSTGVVDDGSTTRLVREAIGELDRKAADLERLVKAADERIAALRAVAKEKGVEPGRGTLDEKAEDGDALARDICRLAESGQTPLEIATRLGQHVGKVELILALRR